MMRKAENSRRLEGSDRKSLLLQEEGVQMWRLEPTDGSPSYLIRSLRISETAPFEDREIAEQWFNREVGLSRHCPSVQKKLGGR
ncbi:hypothetical protein MRBLMA1_001399 [Sphingobium sp. LMA1-1-1.1]|uniref:hypothetical protein n=1 Tax=unclassified Sphingobium TaxID=2611147 RepID=UPI003421A8D1